MFTAVVRATLRDDVDLKDLENVEEKMIELGSSMPGFQEVKEFKANDGELVMLVTFDTRENMISWRDHPAHKKTQQRGRECYFSKYNAKICEVVQHYSFSDGKRTEHKL